MVASKSIASTTTSWTVDSSNNKTISELEADAGRIWYNSRGAIPDNNYHLNIDQRITGKSRRGEVTNNINSRKTPSRSVTLKRGTVEKLLETEENRTRLSKPVVVPTTMEKNLYKKVSEKKKIELDLDELEDEPIEDSIEEKPKRRGRPRKNPVEEETKIESEKPRRRGRPKKVAEEVEEKFIDDTENNVLPGFEDEQDEDKFENVNYRPERIEESSVLPGFEEDEEDEEDDDENNTAYDNNQRDVNYSNYSNVPNQREDKRYNEDYGSSYKEHDTQYDNIFDDAEFESLLSTNRKIATFVGTSKNGTSFIINNIAQILSGMGVKTAILDTTQNQNAYYIYTQNDEDLRKKAIQSLENLKRRCCRWSKSEQ